MSATTNHFGEVYKALGQSRIYAWLMGTTTVITMAGLAVVGMRGLGLVAMVVVLMAVRLVRVLFDLVILRRLVDLRPVVALRAVLPAAASTALMCGVVLAARGAVAAWPAGLQLVTLSAAGAAVYAGALALLDRGLIAEIRELLRSAIGGRTARLS
jgi:hypothetical protein